MSAPAFALVIADGRRSKYGITACLGALEDLPEGAYPDVRWPADDEDLGVSVARLGRAGVLPIVLWSSFSPEFPDVLARRRRVAEVSGDAPAVHLLGGPHASAEPELCLRAGFDRVAPGEGELTVRSLVVTLNAGGSLDEVAGLARLDATGAFVRARGTQVESLDRFPSYALRQGRIGPIELTRGCVYACAFCQTPYVFKARWRHRSPDSVAWHVRALVARGKRHVRFLTPSALSYGAEGTEPNLDAVEALLRRVRAELPADGKVYLGTFPSEIRPEHATREALAMVKRWADNDNVIVGAQSGSDAVLAASHRGHDVASVRTAVENCLAVGLAPNVDVIFGMPDESEADAQATIDLCRDLMAVGARIHTHTFLPLPGTPWAREAAGTIGPELRAELGRLVGEGRAYGNWRRQEDVARALAASESGRRPGRGARRGPGTGR